MKTVTVLTATVSAAVLSWGVLFAAPSYAADKSVEGWVAKQEQALMQKLSSQIALPAMKVTVPVKQPQIRTRLVTVANR